MPKKRKAGGAKTKAAAESKAEKRKRKKVVEDKTFGLKNKKGKKNQMMIRELKHNMAQQAQRQRDKAVDKLAPQRKKLTKKEREAIERQNEMLFGKKVAKAKPLPKEFMKMKPAVFDREACTILLSWEVDKGHAASRCIAQFNCEAMFNKEDGFVPCGKEMGAGSRECLLSAEQIAAGSGRMTKFQVNVLTTKGNGFGTQLIFIPAEFGNKVMMEKARAEEEERKRKEAEDAKRFKKKKKKKKDDFEGLTLEEVLEKNRNKVLLEGRDKLTKCTPETFKIWQAGWIEMLAERKRKKLVKKQKRRAKKAKKLGKGAFLAKQTKTGKELFEEDAAKYNVDEGEQSDAEADDRKSNAGDDEKTEVTSGTASQAADDEKAPDAADDLANAIGDASLFLDDDLLGMELPPDES